MLLILNRLSPALLHSLLILEDFASGIEPDPDPFAVSPPVPNPAENREAANAPIGPKVPIPLQIRVGDRFSSEGLSAGGRFELMAKVGQGGMGVFYKVFDHKQQRVVGLKALLQSGREDARQREEAILRFDNEIKIGSQLDHDHLVSVYETIEFADGSRGMLMKFIDGKSLGQVMQTLTYRQAVDILLDVASGVAHMHSKGIVHRDLKPDNIIIRSGDGRAFVTDFGIAKSMKDAPVPADLSSFPSLQSPDLTAGGLIGTVGYYDPSLTKIVAGRDLFALGAILYQLIADGRQAFRDYDVQGRPIPEAPIGIARRIVSWLDAVERNQEPPWKIPPAGGGATRGTDYIAGEVLRIVHKCLRRRAPHAFRSVPDFMADLLTVKTASLKRGIDSMERELEVAMKVELPVFLLRSGTTIDPALNPADMSDEELSDLLHSPVSRRDGKILVTAGTREFLPPLERQALDELDLKLERQINLWRTEIGFVANRIVAKGWPLQGLIAEAYFDLLVHQEYELSRQEIDALIPWVADHESPLPDGSRPMTAALKGDLPVVIEDLRDFMTGEHVRTATRIDVHPLVEKGDSGQYWPGDALDPSSLSLRLGDILVLRLENDDYAPVSIPVQASLKKRKELIDRGLPLTIAPELVARDLVDDGFTLIHGGTSVVGVRYGHKNGRYSIPQMAFHYGPFAVKTATLGDYLKKFILPMIRSGRPAGEVEALVPRSGSKAFIDIDWEKLTIDVHEKDPRDNPISMTQNVRGVTPNDLFSFAKFLGLEVIDSFRWEVVATNGIQGFISPTGSTVRAIYLPSFNGVENWYRDEQTGIERPRNPSDIQIPEMDSIPAGADRSDNLTLVHGIGGPLGPGLHATSTPGTIDNIVARAVSITATTDAVNFNARKEQMRPKHLPFQISDYAALLIRKYDRKK